MKKNWHLANFFYQTILLLSFIITSFVLNAQQSWQSVNSGVINPYNSYRVGALATIGNTVYAAIDTAVYKWTGNGWVQLGSFSTTNGATGQVNTIISDPFGNLFATGFFTNAHSKYYVAKWNGKSWVELGSLNPNGEITTMTADANGNLYVTGNFTNNIAQFYVAKWNGTNWSELKNSTSALNATGFINSIATDALGNVYAAGNFTNASKYPYVAKWDGKMWTELGGGSAALNPNGNIYSVITSPTGHVYASGYFKNSAGLPYIAEWVGDRWNALPNVPSNFINYQFISKLTADSAGNIYPCSYFTDSKGYGYIPKWNGVSWTKEGTGFNGNDWVRDIAIDKAGNIYASGMFKDAEGLCYVSKLNVTTSAWNELGVNGTGFLSWLDDCVAFTPNNVYALISDPVNYFYELYQWNGNYWAFIPNSPDFVKYGGTTIRSITGDNKGNLYLGGENLVNAKASELLWKWDGINWTRLDTVGGYSLTHQRGGFYNIISDRKGNIYGTGYLPSDSGIIVKWDGTSYSEIRYQKYPPPIYTTDAPLISAIAVDTSGNLYAGLLNSQYYDPNFYVAKWDGGKWVRLGSPAAGDFKSEVYALAADNNGNVYASVEWYDPPTQSYMKGIQKWNGTEWRSIDTTDKNDKPIDFLFVDRNNNLYIGEPNDFGYRNVKKYNSDGWTILGTNTTALNANGKIKWIGSDIYNNLYAFGNFTQSSVGQGLVRYGTNGILPVKIIKFTGHLNENDAILKWQTSLEVNANYFNIKRSFDGLHFTTIGRVMASENNGLSFNYSYTDNLNALDNSISKIYYRLEEVDKDSKSTNSEIVRLVMQEGYSKWNFKIRPVPVKNTLHLQLINTTGKSSISIFDIEGKKVFFREINESNVGNISIDVSALNHELYFLKVLYNGQTKALKFVKY